MQLMIRVGYICRNGNGTEISVVVEQIEKIATLDPLLPGQVWMSGRRDSVVDATAGC